MSVLLPAPFSPHARHSRPPGRARYAVRALTWAVLADDRSPSRASRPPFRGDFALLLVDVSRFSTRPSWTLASRLVACRPGSAPAGCWHVLLSVVHRPRGVGHRRFFAEQYRDLRALRVASPSDRLVDGRGLRPSTMRWQAASVRVLPRDQHLARSASARPAPGSPPAVPSVAHHHRVHLVVVAGERVLARS